MPAEIEAYRLAWLEPDHPDRGRGAVLLVVGVQDQQHAQGADGFRVADVRLRRDGEHHPQEVRLVVERVVGVHVGLADGLLVRRGRDRRELGEQPQGGQLDVRLVERVAAVLVERRERADRRSQDRHRVGVHRERVEEVAELLADERVALDLVDPCVQLLGRRQLALDQEVGDFEERRALGKFLDRVAAVAQDPVVAVEVCDGASGGRRVRISVVERNQPRVLEQRRDVDRRLSLGRGLDRQHELTLAHLQPGDLCRGGRTRSLHRRHRCLALPSAGAHRPRPRGDRPRRHRRRRMQLRRSGWRHTVGSIAAWGQGPLARAIGNRWPGRLCLCDPGRTAGQRGRGAVAADDGLGLDRNRPPDPDPPSPLPTPPRPPAGYRPRKVLIPATRPAA